jgi:hypothetical protein
VNLGRPKKGEVTPDFLASERARSMDRNPCEALLLRRFTLIRRSISLPKTAGKEASPARPHTRGMGHDFSPYLAIY